MRRQRVSTLAIGWARCGRAGRNCSIRFGRFLRLRSGRFCRGRLLGRRGLPGSSADGWLGRGRSCNRQGRLVARGSAADPSSVGQGGQDGEQSIASDKHAESVGGGVRYSGGMGFRFNVAISHALCTCRGAWADQDSKATKLTDGTNKGPARSFQGSGEEGEEGRNAFLPTHPSQPQLPNNGVSYSQGGREDGVQVSAAMQ